jgi:hypothetical protein
MRHDEDRLHYAFWLYTRPIIAILAAARPFRKAERAIHRTATPRTTGQDAHRIT